MTVERVSDCAFFVPPYYSRNIFSHIPGLINRGITVDKPDQQEEEEIDEKENDNSEDTIKKICLPD